MYTCRSSPRDMGGSAKRPLSALFVGLLLGACASGPGGGAPSAASPGPSTSGATSGAAVSIMDGVYTDAQASRGESTFESSCSGCHQSGEFSGGRFRLRWGGMTAEDVYAFISTAMPDDEPGSLSPGQYTDLVAYFLSLNGYPTGGAELPPSPDAMRALRLDDPDR